ncbi:Histone H4 [Mycena sanguinolenta]|uniref:Histone H4 n=1 Tax=Mycena sanguinolenta TaxID=230812 RepID=A0A8H6YMZ0_9AGAR|nr:Histone H4 [Mycena sanguinolenta]
MIKAERDERMDITHALTPVKQYMAGFTRPTDLRSSNWFPGGAYVSRGKVYESPVEEAYQSHTVFLLESRYNIRYGPGRVEAPDYLYGVCREEDFPAVLKAYNSPKAPRSVLETMDNARWPQGPQRNPHARQRWWANQADLEDTLRELGLTAAPPDPDHPGDEEDMEDKPPKPQKLRRATNVKSRPSIPHEPPDNNASIQSAVRTFHSSSILPAVPPVLGSSSAGYKRGFHTTTLMRAAEAEWDFERARAQDPAGEWIPRSQYMRSLETIPFWRPLISLTVSTRPIALTLVRLSRGLSTGRPFHADIDNHDKKCRYSFVHRMRTMRLQRIHKLAVDMAEVLAGMRGGVVGIRFEADSLGRGIGGEGLADPIPWGKRVIRVGVARWYRLASELKELFHAKAEEIPAANPFEIYTLDDFGHRISDETGEIVAWNQHLETRVDRLKREPWYAEYLALCRADKLLLRHVSARATSLAKQSTKGRSRTVMAKPERPKVAQAAAVKEEGDEEIDAELRLDDDEDMDGADTNAPETSFPRQ